MEPAKTPPKRSCEVADDSPVKTSPKRARFHRFRAKTAWTPPKPADMNGDLRRQIDMKAEEVPNYQGNPGGLVHERVGSCQICKRNKHTCAWETRANCRASVVTGSQCFSCSKACRHLGITRSMATLEAVPGALGVVKEWSKYFAELRRSRGGIGDSCTCTWCRRTGKK